MRKIVNALLVTYGCLMSQISLAAWSSGGGELIQDAHNPWFIQNTPRVTYCIIHNREHFKLNEEEGFPLNQQIEKALNYWRNEFRTAPNVLNKVFVATQDFVQSNCDENTDIRFQFGHLSETQLIEMGKLSIDPRGFVSLAVRTNYDQKNLRGKGFVYLAADSGPLRPTSDDMRDHPWAVGSGALIYKVLVHELGHVFGLQHQSNDFSFMAGNYPESVVTKTGDMGYTYHMPSFFEYSQPQDLSFCLNVGTQAIATKFFGIPNDWACYETRYHENQLEIWGRQNANDGRQNMQLIGSATFDSRPTGADRYDVAISLWLPKAQEVYPSTETRERILWGPMTHQIHRKGIYKSVVGNLSRPLSVLFSPNFIMNKISGIMDNQLFIDIQNNE